ncbi:unnamed protein product [Orchesella dallaii]|uniref:Uncharacterized protein n=1 Tax=Orchesella dallaii TaxID=48710 RepID=A0ABP1RVQ0_9HEXA
MRPTLAAKKSGPYIAVGFTIWLQLICGLEATTWTAFYNNPKGYFLPYLFFGGYLTIATGLMYLTGPEICYRLKQTPTKFSILNRLFLICTSITFSVFFLLFNPQVILLPGINDNEPTLMLQKSYSACLIVMIVFPSIYMISSSYSVEQLPLLIFVILLQLGVGFAVTIRIPTVFMNEMLENHIWLLLIMYAIFDIDLIVIIGLIWLTGHQIFFHKKRNVFELMSCLFWTSRFLAISTGILVIALGSLIGFPVVVTSNFGNYVLGVYIYSCYFLILLEIIAKRPAKEVSQDVERIDTNCNAQEPAYEIPLVSIVF